MSKIILGIASQIAAGKGMTTEYLTKNYRATSYRFSTILRDILDRLYLEHSRENLAKLSTILRKNFGENILAKVIYEDVKKDEQEIIVIDGVRRLEDIVCLKNYLDSTLFSLKLILKKDTKELFQEEKM